MGCGDGRTGRRVDAVGLAMQCDRRRRATSGWAVTVRSGRQAVMGRATGWCGLWGVTGWRNGSTATGGAISVGFGSCEDEQQITAELLKPNETITQVRRRTADHRFVLQPLRPHLPCSPAPLAHVRPPRPRRPSASSTERTSSDGWVVRVASRSDGRRISVARSAKRNGQEATGERITLEARRAAR